ncbi:hypothetical protein TIFTF001_021412 [Ficus carica]|uniref:Uncharacterized protein n=1 Tax=Ficus carica TaxID=3494 RepID=A0AA88DDL7_FICCA|nr:hypothetical protein TIFTF001_021412 [Ficus carica]
MGQVHGGEGYDGGNWESETSEEYDNECYMYASNHHQIGSTNSNGLKHVESGDQYCWDDYGFCLGIQRQLDDYGTWKIADYYCVWP